MEEKRAIEATTEMLSYFHLQKGLEVKDTNRSSPPSKKRAFLERLASRLLEQNKKQQRESKAAIILQNGEDLKAIEATREMLSYSYLRIENIFIFFAYAAGSLASSRIVWVLGCARHPSDAASQPNI